MTHTPGRWREGEIDGSIVSDSGDGLALGYHGEYDHYGGYLIADIVSACNRPLIAAAPELLEMCKAAHSYIEILTSHAARHGYGNILDTIVPQLLRAIIAKAEGER